MFNNSWLLALILCFIFLPFFLGGSDDSLESKDTEEPPDADDD
jgi:hypothetical protein